MLTKGNVDIGIDWQFGPNWPGQRCEAQGAWFRALGWWIHRERVLFELIKGTS